MGYNFVYLDDGFSVFWLNICYSLKKKSNLLRKFGAVKGKFLKNFNCFLGICKTV